ncbi:hypothetical protein COCVIDRAFT_18237 [Bipolaris victoriae FI3]|uniref:Uncharacterized protein n=1 Tax=Bipolaris victoriae (strain FI3) TaxID=930091 RepID=W7EBF7_BIPV3|nr:hypothetical protein COCVIDRAFT_18237 [Bipolaris victoriae FI3]
MASRVEQAMSAAGGRLGVTSNYGPCQANRHGPGKAAIWTTGRRGRNMRVEGQRAEISVIRPQQRVPCFAEMKGSAILAALHDRDGREKKRSASVSRLQPLCRIIAMASAPASTNALALALALAAASVHLGQLGREQNWGCPSPPIPLPSPSLA